MSNKRKAAMLEERELQIEARTNQWKGYIRKANQWDMLKGRLYELMVHVWWMVIQAFTFKTCNTQQF